MEKISAVIITRNEEQNIVDCLQTLDFLDEIVVVDSGSSDKTVFLAKKYSKKVFAREWKGYAAQKNYGISRTRNDWILSIDADERISEELKKEILELEFKADGYFLPVKNFFLGKLMKYGGQYPDYHLRLFRKSKGKFTYSAKDVHETVRISGSKIVRLNNPILHYSYNSVSGYFHKYNSYTYLDASGRFHRNIKPSWYGMLIRPVSRFFKWYFFKLGILDGTRGLIFHLFSALYIFTAELKLFEIYHHNYRDIKWKT